MTPRKTAANYVTAFATGWPEEKPDVLILSLTTHEGVKDFAMNKDQALLVAKTLRRTAENLPGAKA